MHDVFQQYQFCAAQYGRPHQHGLSMQARTCHHTEAGGGWGGWPEIAGYIGQKLRAE